MSAQNTNEEVPIAGINSILPKEHGNKFYTLQILQHLEKDVCAIASWDSSLHDSQALNRVTEGKPRQTTFSLKLMSHKHYFRSVDMQPNYFSVYIGI